MVTITIGKSKTNQCVISDPSVSRHHATLSLSSDERTGILKDMNSTNGTYVNGKRITVDTQVTAADKIQLGTVVTSLAQIIKTARSTRVSQSSSVGGGAAQGGNHFTIGRSPNCRIVLNHDDVSSDHAAIYRDASGAVFIEDHNSTNGTYVNGVKITGQRLNPGDTVLISKKYPVAWEQLFPAGASPQPADSKSTSNTKKFIMAAAAIVVLCLGFVVVYKFIIDRWDEKRVYKEYSSAVCFVYVQYGYKIYVDGEDVTKGLFKSDLIHMEDGDVQRGATGASGTAFFISDDGKLATNLHIVRPWLFTDDKAVLEKAMDNFLTQLSMYNPQFTRSKAEVKGVIEALLVVPNGLPISQSNAIECDELSASNDINKDVAIIQTATRRLPVDVKRVISIDDADESDDALQPGNKVFTIGFPYGANIGLDSHNNLQNQVHSGIINQDRGDIDFGHSAETAGGASGSPIINDRGRLIGVHHGGLTGVTGAQGFNRAIKVKYLKSLMN